MLSAPDYLDAIDVAGARSAEDWARAVFEGAPGMLRLILRSGWRWGLALRIGPFPAPGRVLGWPILHADPGRVVLGVRSPLLGECRLVFQADAERLVLTTVIEYAGRASRPLWTLVSPVHRAVTRMLVTRAAS